MLKSGLQVFCYNLTSHKLVDYSQFVQSLTFTTLSPGGCGQATFTLNIKTRDTLIYRDELQLFARVAIMAPSMDASQGRCLFVGEIMDVPETMDQSGDYINITALGLGASLRDDPQTTSYAAQTGQQIIDNQISIRSSYIVIDTDTSQVFPDNPASTFSPAYTNRTMEEVISDISTLDGLYSWGTWPHPQHRDALNFPTGQLVIHLKNTSTINYRASVIDIQSYNIQPSAERAYNVIDIMYNDPSQSPPVGHATYTDSRIAAGNAPFRRRKYVRDLTSITTVTKAQAQAIANTYGAQMQNITYKNTVVLTTARNAAGNEIPLWNVMADQNIAIPEMARRNNTLAAVPTGGVNMWYIVQTSYAEDASGTMTQTLQLDNYVDSANMRIAQLQLASDTLQRSRTTTGIVQTAGAPEYGQCGLSLPSVGAGNTSSVGVNFKTVMTNVPSSISLTALQSTNVGSTSISNITAYGFVLNVVATAAGAVTYFATYKTVGN